MPRTNELWTHSHALLCPMNITDTQVNIKDLAYPLSKQPMFGGHAAFEYSKAAHCVAICDHIGSYSQQLMEQVFPDEEDEAWDLPLRKIRLMSLFYMAHHAYLEPLLGVFSSYETHRARLISVFLTSIGEEYSVYKRYIPLYDLVDENIKANMYNRFYDRNCADAFLPNSMEAAKLFLDRVEQLRDKWYAMPTGRWA